MIEKLTVGVLGKVSCPLHDRGISAFVTQILTCLQVQERKKLSIHSFLTV